MTFCVTMTLKIDGIVHDSGNAKDNDNDSDSDSYSGT